MWLKQHIEVRSRAQACKRFPSWSRLVASLLVLACLTDWAMAAQIAQGKRGMVVSRHPEASRVGAEILRAGGNAMDAAVATAMALAVVLPQAGNVGGGGFLLYRRGSDGFTTSIDFRETAPAATHRDVFLDAGGALDTVRVRTGHQAAGVPGSVAGLHLAWSKYGRLPWARLLEPAIELAEKGYRVNGELATALKDKRALLARFPATAALYLPKGKPLGTGHRVMQPELAQTLRLLAAEGPDPFYRGDIAAAIVQAMEQGGGFISAEDLASYRPLERPVLHGHYRELEVICMAPPSSGGVTLLQILGLLEGFDLAQLEPQPAMPIHVMVESMARAFADRNIHLGDPDFVPLPLRGMLSSAYLAERRRTISMDRATPSRFIAAGNVWTFEERAFHEADDPSRSPVDTLETPQFREPDETTHLSIADEEGSVVALTTTLNGSFGNGVMVRGFLLNNEMDDFDAQPGVANMYGLVGGEANAIAPGKRMLSSMSPTIVLREGKPWLVLGARGGPRIITAVLQVIVSMHDFGMDLPAAMAAKRIHHQWKPDIIYYEDNALPGEAQEHLRRMGHRLQMWPPTKSSVQCLEVTPKGSIRGVSEPRRQGAAVGY